MEYYRGRSLSEGPREGGRVGLGPDWREGVLVLHYSALQECS